jgi:hypothetical protein
MIPENAVWAKDLEMCKAIRETVALIVDPGLVVSDCKDETEEARSKRRDEQTAGSGTLDPHRRGLGIIFPPLSILRRSVRP